MKIKKGDNVIIIKGKDRNKTGKVLQVFIEKNRIIVEGINLFKKHQKPKKEGSKGEVVNVPRSLNVSNAMIFCKNCNSPARISFKIEGDTKYRVCQKCGSKI
ncbi:MAG: 50S ribosomal protein L24 [Candidatus Parcubacteria bacterium]|nr:50S ribosomal protein L24 [Candidatus Parcubacteria bacterium]